MSVQSMEADVTGLLVAGGHGCPAPRQYSDEQPLAVQILSRPTVCHES